MDGRSLRGQQNAAGSAAAAAAAAVKALKRTSPTPDDYEPVRPPLSHPLPPLYPLILSTLWRPNNQRNLTATAILRMSPRHPNVKSDLAIDFAAPPFLLGQAVVVQWTIVPFGLMTKPLLHAWNRAGMRPMIAVAVVPL